MNTDQRKPGRFYLVTSVIVFLFGVALAVVGIYVGGWGSGWSDGFVYLSFGLTALVAASSFATVRGQMIAQQALERQLIALAAGKPIDAPPLNLSEKLQVLRTGRWPR